MTAPREQVPRDQVRRVLRLAIPARLATVDPDGFPWITPLWFIWEDGAFHMTSVRGTRQLRNLQRDPRAAVAVDIEDETARHGIRATRQVKGKGRAEILEDDGGAWTRRITLKYVPGDEGQALAERRAAMDRWLIRVAPGRLVAVGTPGAVPRSIT